MTRADTDTALAAERAEADATAVAFANSERHVNELLSACVIKDDTINKQAVELDEAKAYQATLLQRIKELEAQIAPTKFGVCSHQLTFRTSIYAQDAKVKQAVLDSGASFIRDLLPMAGDTTPIIADYFTTADIKHHLTVGRWQDVGTYDFAKAMKRLRSIAGCVAELAGVNEPDGDGRPRSEWLPKIVAHQTKLWDEVNKDPQTVGLPVGLGALRWVNRNMFGDLEAMVKACAGKFDFVNLHFYPGNGSDVHAELADAVQRIRTFSDKPIIISEGGGSTANMTLEEQGRICADMVKAGRDLGVKVYLYELMDDPDASGKDLQSNFGLFESDFSPKPAASAVRALVKP